MTKTVKAYAAFLPELRQLLSAKDLATLKNVLREINPVDLAEGGAAGNRDSAVRDFRMKRRVVIGMVVCALAALGGVARAEYKKPSSGPAESPARFEEAMDLSRYRKGNLEWDTQELIASGMKALHEEHLRILDKLDRIESRLNKLEK